MREQDAFAYVIEAYDGGFPVFTTGFYTLNILSSTDELANDFLGRFPVEEMGDDQVRMAFSQYLDEYVFTTFSDAHLADPDCLFPWTTAPRCRFEEPYAIKPADGEMRVFRDMIEWLEFLDGELPSSIAFDTFEDFARSLGVRLLCDC